MKQLTETQQEMTKDDSYSSLMKRINRFLGKEKEPEKPTFPPPAKKKVEHFTLTQKNDLANAIYEGEDRKQMIKRFAHDWGRTERAVESLIYNMMVKDPVLKTLYDDARGKKFNTKVQTREELVTGALMNMLPEGTAMYSIDICNILAETVPCNINTAKDYVKEAMDNGNLIVAETEIREGFPIRKWKWKYAAPEIKEEPAVETIQEPVIPEKKTRKKGKFAFYSQEEIEELIKAIQEMKDINNLKERRRVARRHAREWKRSEGGVRARMSILIRGGIPAVQPVPEKKDIPITPSVQEGVLFPPGSVFEGIAKRVVIYPDHFEVYF